MLKSEEMTQKEISQEIKRLDSQLNQLLVIAIILTVGFITELVLLILGIVPFNLLAVGTLAILPLGVIQNIKKGREINLKMFCLDLFKTDIDLLNEGE